MLKDPSGVGNMGLITLGQQCNWEEPVGECVSGGASKPDSHITSLQIHPNHNRTPIEESVDCLRVELMFQSMKAVTIMRGCAELVLGGLLMPLP